LQVGHLARTKSQQATAFLFQAFNLKRLFLIPLLLTACFAGATACPAG
jgi:hypothetical protein